MQEKERLILKELEKTPLLTAAQLADRLGISRKTVQKLLLEVGQALPVTVARLDSKPGKGYQLVIEDAQALGKWLSSQESQIAETSQARQLYMLNLLLTQPYIKLSDLQDSLYVSRKTLSNDLTALRRCLSVYDVAILSRPHYGLYLSATEAAIRLMMLLVDGVDLYQLSDQETEGLDLFLRERGLRTDFYRSNVLSLLRVAISRSRLGHHLDQTNQTCASHILTLSKHFGWGFEVADAMSIEEAIQSFQVKTLSTLRQGELEACLGLVEETFGLDFSQDELFFTSLWQHVQKLYDRTKHRISLKNPLLADIKSHLKNEFVMASLLSGALAREWGQPILEDEIGFLSLIFATRTSQIKDFKKHMLVVCFESGSSRDFLKTSYQTLFGSYVHQVTVCHPEDLAQQDLQAYDCIVSTVEIAELAPYHPQYVPYFLEERDKEAIKQRLSTSENLFVDQVLAQARFVSPIQASSKEETVKLICEQLTDGSASDLKDRVLERLAMGVTQLGNKVALLHPKGQVERHFISVSVLERPLYWETSEVSVVVLVSLPTIDSASRLIYQILSTFVLEDFYVDWLLQSPTAANLQAILQKIKEKELENHVH